MYSNLKVTCYVPQCDDTLKDGLQYGQSLSYRISEQLIDSDTSYNAKAISPASFDLEVRYHISTPTMYQFSQIEMEGCWLPDGMVTKACSKRANWFELEA